MNARQFTWAAACLLIAPVAASAQGQSTTAAKNTPAVAARIEPPRVLSGVMKDNLIEVRQSDWIKTGKRLFLCALTEARIVDGRLEFTGSLLEARRLKSQAITALLVSTSARSANPWPSATAPTAQPRQRAIQNAQGQQPTANQAQPPGNPQAPERTERNEQTQSLFSAGERGTGCELLYFKLQPPGQSAPAQVGVVLAHQDNARGNEINQAVCHVVRALGAKEKADEALARLNRLLGQK